MDFDNLQSGVEGVSQCYFYCGFLLLWERLRIYSGKLFIAIKIKSVNIYATPFIFSNNTIITRITIYILVFIIIITVFTEEQVK
jgi:hypothetical protein